MTTKTARPASTIMLPEARIAQLRALADANGVTLTETIERLINNEIAAGRLPDTLPGFEVTPAVRRVYLTVDDFTFPAMTVRQARQIADLLTDITHDQDGHRQGFKFGPGAEAVVFGVARRGRGIVIGGDDPQTGRSVKATVTPSMARDLSRIIRTEAGKAAKHY